MIGAAAAPAKVRPQARVPHCRRKRPVPAAGKPRSFLHVVRSEIDLAPEADDHAPEVYAQADRNGDGLLSLEESAILPRLHERFLRFDRNGDGVITLEELLQFRRSLAPRRSKLNE